MAFRCTLALNAAHNDKAFNPCVVLLMDTGHTRCQNDSAKGGRLIYENRPHTQGPQAPAAHHLFKAARVRFRSNFVDAIRLSR